MIFIVKEKVTLCQDKAAMEELWSWYCYLAIEWKSHQQGHILLQDY